MRNNNPSFDSRAKRFFDALEEVIDKKIEASSFKGVPSSKENQLYTHKLNIEIKELRRYAIEELSALL